MNRPAWVAALFWVASAVHAQPTAASPEPQGQPEPSQTLVDREFGVRTPRYGLAREVEMYQWLAAGQGYRKAWSPRPIDSSGFAAGHENPAAFPLPSRRWTADAVSLDGRPVDPAVLERFGAWRRFRPGFSALPGNLAATFQPEGDGLGSAENPLEPRIGDLRIHWSELVLPPLAGKVELRNGVWIPAAADQPASMADTRDGADASVGRAWRQRLLPLGLGLGALLLVVLVLRRRRR